MEAALGPLVTCTQFCVYLLRPPGGRLDAETTCEAVCLHFSALQLLDTWLQLVVWMLALGGLSLA
jgi:hypothetical protein